MKELPLRGGEIVHETLSYQPVGEIIYIVLPKSLGLVLLYFGREANIYNVKEKKIRLIIK